MFGLITVWRIGGVTVTTLRRIPAWHGGLLLAGIIRAVGSVTLYLRFPAAVPKWAEQSRFMQVCEPADDLIGHVGCD